MSLVSLVLNEDQLMLKDSAAGFLAEKSPLSALRRLRDERDETGYSTALWQEMAELGWAGMAIDEAYGGLGFGYTGLGVVLEEMGRKLTASPMQASIVTGAAAVALGGGEDLKHALLPALAGGTMTMTLAVQETASHNPLQTSTSALPQASAYLLNGRKLLVADVHTADRIVVVARTSGSPGEEHGLTLFLVDADSEGLGAERVFMVDSRNSGRLILDQVHVDDGRILGEVDRGWPLLQQILDIANIGLSAELLGLSLEAFERTLEYLKERRQFGAAIGSFQGLQHRAAELYTELELARSIVLGALQAIDRGDKRLPVLAAACKAKLCQVATRVTSEAIQMHGGIGMTDEIEIGFFIKRAKVAQQTFGDYHYQLDRFAAANAY